MRDIVLVLATLVYLPMSLRYPAVGAMCWLWFSVMSPHREIYSFAQGQPFNSVIAAATLIGWLASRERKHWTPDLMPWLMLAWMVWMTVNSYFVPFPSWSWPYWDRVIRILALTFLVFFLANTKARIHGLIWVLVISIGYYGVKGGLFTLKTGGQYIAYGPSDTVISDNNHIALAIVMILPLTIYLCLQSQNLLLRIGLIVSMALQVVMVLGSNSRGGLIALFTVLGLMWLRNPGKLLYGIAGVIVVGAALNFMPDSFWERVNTLNNVNDDSSFQGRVTAWMVAFRVAVDYFPFGAGYYAPQLSPIYNNYFPGASTHAAHSIYFQILGEHGFIGLAIYLTILVLAFRNTSLIIGQTRRRDELRWAYDLACMTQISLIGFFLGGSALSLAYFDGYLLLIALLSTLRELVAASLSKPAAPTPAALSPAANRLRPIS